MGLIEARKGGGTVTVTEELLTPAEVAQRLRVSEDAVYLWLREGKLRGLKVGGRLWRVRPSDLEAFLQPRATAPTP
jgi:excisionase family DNA binding protein